jgi:serine/threonine-protein kinase
MGTPHYKSPEQCRGANVDHRTDVYAYGVLCHVVLCGRVPFDGPSVMDVLVKHMNSAPPRMSEEVPGVAPQLDAPVQHMMAKNAEERPQSVGAAFAELNDAARSAGFSVRPNAIVTPGGSPGTSRSGISGDLGAPARTGPRPISTLGGAKTVATGDVPNRTFTPAASDIRPPPGRMLGLYIGAGLGVLVAAGVAVMLLSRHQPPPDLTAPSTSLGAVASPTPSVATASPGATAAPPASAEPAPSASAAGLATAPTTAASAAPSALVPKKPPPGPVRPPPAAASVSKDLEPF